MNAKQSYKTTETHNHEIGGDGGNTISLPHLRRAFSSRIERTSEKRGYIRSSIRHYRSQTGIFFRQVIPSKLPSIDRTFFIGLPRDHRDNASSRISIGQRLEITGIDACIFDSNAHTSPTAPRSCAWQEIDVQ